MEINTTMFNLTWSNGTYSSGHSTLGTLTTLIDLWQAKMEIPSVWIGNDNKMDLTISNVDNQVQVTIRNPVTNEAWSMMYEHTPSHSKQKYYKFPLP